MQSQWDSGKREVEGEEEEEECCLSTKYRPGPRKWKQPGSDFARQKVVCLFFTHFKLYTVEQRSMLHILEDDDIIL